MADLSTELVEIFSISSPTAVRSSLCEAFQLKFKIAPSANPRKFQVYVQSEAQRDEDIRRLLEELRTKSKRSSLPGTQKRFSIDRQTTSTVHSFPPPQPESGTTRRGSHRISEESCGNSSSSSSSSSQQVLVRNPIIYSLYEGVEAAMEALNQLRYHTTGAFRRCPSLNSNLKENPNSNSSRIKKEVPIRIDSPKFLSNTDEYSLLISDHRVYAQTLARRCHRLARSLLQALENRDLVFRSPYTSDSDASVFVGRVMREVEEEAIQDKTKLKFCAILEPLLPPNFALGPSPVQLVLNAVTVFDLFPGQTIAIVGTSKMDHSQFARLYPTEIVQGLPIPSPVVPTGVLNAFSETCLPLSLIAVSGPFCPPEVLDTFLLDQLITRLESQPAPDILLLLGPFVAANNKIVASDGIVLQEEPDGPIQFLSHEVLYTLMLTRLMTSPLLSRTAILIVPSTDDIGHPFPIPQPPLDFNRLLNVSVPQKNVKFLSNPCNIVLGDAVKISVTSTDPIMPLLELLDSTSPKPEWIEKSCTLLLQQRGLFPTHQHAYPVHPEYMDKSPCIWHENELPDILIYSSPSGPRGMIYNERAFVNVGTLGSSVRPCYCELTIHPLINSDKASEMSHLRLSERLRVDVIDWS